MNLCYPDMLNPDSPLLFTILDLVFWNSVSVFSSQVSSHFSLLEKWQPFRFPLTPASKPHYMRERK